MIYRLSYVTLDDHSHAGYEYAGNRREADRLASKARLDGCHVEIETLATPRTKTEVLRVLNVYGSHNDNG